MKLKRWQRAPLISFCEGVPMGVALGLARDNHEFVALFIAVGVMTLCYVDGKKGWSN
jgi:hypothetical protein